NYGSISYQLICSRIINSFINPNLTLSAFLLKKLIIFNLNQFGLILANHYAYYFSQQPMIVIKKDDLQYENRHSWNKQYSLEKNNKISFSNFLMQLNQKYNLYNTK
ncbi:MAG: hypothetical protein N4Q03_00570, partial [Candidatus Lightella neohaematopini]|nr:hypothetical protein [Candidatus Lightella neohaematopini]